MKFKPPSYAIKLLQRRNKTWSNWNLRIPTLDVTDMQYPIALTVSVACEASLPSHALLYNIFNKKTYYFRPSVLIASRIPRKSQNDTWRVDQNKYITEIQFIAAYELWQDYEHPGHGTNLWRALVGYFKYYRPKWVLCHGTRQRGKRGMARDRIVWGKGAGP